jgi:hypothetical protein
MEARSAARVATGEWRKGSVNLGHGRGREISRKSHHSGGWRKGNVKHGTDPDRPDKQGLLT